jgi:fucose permease
VPRLHRDRITWLIYLQLGIWGYFLYGFGPVVPLLRDEQHVGSGVASLHSVALAVGALVGGAVFPGLSRRLGRGRAMWLGLTGLAAGIVALCLLRPVVATVGSTLVLASFGTVLLSGVVAALGERHGPAGPAAIAEANAIASGLGAVAPLVVGATVAAGLTWRPAIAAVVAMIALVALAARIFRVPLPSGSSPPPPRVPPHSTVPVVRSGTGRLPVGYWLAWFLMCCTGSVEVCLNLWAGDVLRHHAGMSAGGAATAVSAIVGGMCLGRVAGGRLAQRVPAPRLLLAALGVSLAGFAIFWLAIVPGLAIAGLAVAGLGNGVHYPLAIGMALRLSPGREDQAASRASYAMAVGFGIAPFALGAFADRVGAHSAFLLVPLFLAVAAGLVLPLARRLTAAAEQRPAAASPVCQAPAVAGSAGVAG